MSRKTWGITFAISTLVLIIAVSLWYYMRDVSTPPEEQNGTVLVEMLPVESKPGQVESRLAPSQTEIAEESASDEDDMENYRYKLVNDNNYVTVYQLPENELYEYTDVIMDVLPVELQEEIHQGKYLKNERELYNFLENYTS